MPAIRRVLPEDVALVKSVRLQALLESPAAFGGTYREESRWDDSQWRARTESWCEPLAAGFLALEAGKACGMLRATLAEDGPDRARLHSMWVAPPFRRGSLGTELMHAVERWAAGLGARELVLTVVDNNLSAIRFYERNGFLRTGRTEPYPNDAERFEYEMVKRISGSEEASARPEVATGA